MTNIVAGEGISIKPEFAISHRHEKYIAISHRVAEMLFKAGHGPLGIKDGQAFCIAEEAGEFIQEWRRFTNRARSSSTEAKCLNELADVVISAMVFAASQDWDIDAEIDKKLDVIKERGGR